MTPTSLVIESEAGSTPNYNQQVWIFGGLEKADIKLKPEEMYALSSGRPNYLQMSITVFKKLSTSVIPM